MEEQPSKESTISENQVLKENEDLILMADGSEVVLTQGDIETCPS